MGEAFTYVIDESSVLIEDSRFEFIQTIPPGRARISSPFGYRINPVTDVFEFHTGVDMAFVYGTPVVAIQRAVITSVDYNDISGHFVRYRTMDGLIVGYAHLSQIFVEVGEIVEQGAVVAYTGNSGRSTAPHLHVSIWQNGVLVDPLTIFEV